jgi:hypothetical protein
VFASIFPSTHTRLAVKSGLRVGVKNESQVERQALRDAHALIVQKPSQMQIFALSPTFLLAYSRNFSPKLVLRKKTRVVSFDWWNHAFNFLISN